MESSYYWDLIARKLSGKATAEEEKELESWIKKNKRNKEDYELQKALWRNTKDSPLSFEVEPAWNGLHNKIRSDSSSQKNRFRTFYRIAASLAIFIFISTLLGYFIHEWQNVILVKAPVDQKIEIKLPDETVVWLNKNSTLKYKKDFGEESRDVILQGEAFFEVAHDKAKPFLIQTGETVTKVLGTSFNLKLNKKAGSVELSVRTGKVAFYKDGYPDQGLNLIAGDIGLFDPEVEGFTKTQYDNDNFIAWNTGILRFDDSDLQEVVQNLEEFYGETIELSPGLKNCKITTTFNNQPLERVLTELQILLEIESIRKEGKIWLSGKGCNKTRF